MGRGKWYRNGVSQKFPGSFVNTVCHFLASKRSVLNLRPENDPKPSTWPIGPKRANRFFLRFTALVQSSKMTPRGTRPMYFQFLNAEGLFSPTSSVEIRFPYLQTCVEGGFTELCWEKLG